MKQFRVSSTSIIMAVLMLLPVSLLAQQDEKSKDKTKDEEEQIIITRKGSSADKVVVEINGDNVTINGKPVDEYKGKDGNVTVRTRKTRGTYDTYMSMPGFNKSWSLNTDSFPGMENKMRYLFNMDENRAMLGVTTEKTDEGVKVNDVTKESAAEKIGLKAGDMITKIDDKAIASPDELSEAIQAHKPGDKVKVTFKRDKKEQSATAELTKWKGMNIITSPGGNYNFNMGDMNFEKIMPKIQSIPQFRGEYWNVYGGNSQKLGLTVQDTDEGKGVKVIGVEEESNAAKAGIKEGDIIQEADGKAINGTDDMVKVVRESRAKKSVMMKVVRSGKTQNIEVKMPRKIKTADL